MPRKQGKGRKAGGKRLTRRQQREKNAKSNQSNPGSKSSSPEPEQKKQSNQSAVDHHRHSRYAELMLTSEQITPKWDLRHTLSQRELNNNRAGFAALSELATTFGDPCAHFNLGEHYFEGLDGVPETPDLIKSSHHYYTFILACTRAKTECTRNIRDILAGTAFNFAGIIGDLNIPKSRVLQNEYYNLCEVRLCLEREVLQNIAGMAQNSVLDWNGVIAIFCYLLGVICERLNKRSVACVMYHKCVKYGSDVSEDAKHLNVAWCVLNSQRHQERIKLTEHEPDEKQREAQSKELRDKYDVLEAAMRDEYKEEAQYTVRHVDPNQPDTWQNYVTVGKDAQGNAVSACVLNCGDFGDRADQIQVSKGDDAVRVCANCGKMGYMMDLCAGCKSQSCRVWYCSRNCQKQHWIDGHREVCEKQKQK